ncbi:MAG: N-6 DNA methylase [Altibacter sp.]|uniref:Eco57I restriction-modification methylase domain-containing protein n=1 Tax=Altibacter sp. TaxID=2024823 RepID=UPI001D243A86|nr:N-6 DNA methylase [Altibacter sp.]MBZ0326798.1 N-6 DNA methylase [Altibacter sp.]
MDKKAAINLIEDTFNAHFSEEQFTLFARNLLNDLEPKSNAYSGNYIWDDYKDHINTYKRIGKYVDPEGEALDVLIVEVKSVLKLERARTALRNFVIKHLSKFEKDYALVAFYSKEDEGADWRFSYIKLEYRSELDEAKGKVKTKKEFTPAKRYSFLVGEYEKAHTAKNQLLPLLQNIANNPTVEELESAFSIEKVTDEFFNQYKDLYVKLFEHFENDTHIKAELAKANIDNARFTKKLLGQIVFLYFLQKKGWLGVPKDQVWGKGQKRFIQNLFDQSQSENANFFKDKLQFLFYEALAKERNNDNSFYKKFNCRIPFLNGGLFEAEYDWQNANISIPTSLFRNEEKNKAGDIGTGALDVFDRYNFTIKEDEPLDKEVAVDPEMLGKVFENMLEITERKSKGAFYTPREIVHYMCQESLIHYLDNSLNDTTASYQAIDSSQPALFPGSTDKKGNLKIELEHKGKVTVPKADIETYIREGHFALENDQRVANTGKETAAYKYQLPESIRQHAELINTKLTEIRICDPAIGSGAFPVGLLHELVNAMLVLKPHFSDKYLKEKLVKLGFENNGETLSVVEVNESRYIYRLKRHIIQESIYGVDIDASAIDIARLRLWLSLVVDEDDLDPIETLPNLDYKIVCGNSLINFPENWKSSVSEIIELMKDQFFNETNADIKKQLKISIDDVIADRMSSSEKTFGIQINFDFRLYFSEVWNEKGGFDVVIGNPPYGAKLTAEEKKFFKGEYSDVHMRTPDTFNYFISKGFRLLHNGGVLTYIVPNNLFFQSEYEKTRRFLLSKNQFHIGINLGDGVFNTATVPSSIFLSSRQNRGINNYFYSDIRNVNKKQIDFNSIFKKESISSTLKVPASVFGITQEEFGIIEQLRSVSVTIDDIAEEMASGISTGGDKIFRVADVLAEELKLEKDLLKPVLVGGEIDKYRLQDTHHSVIYTDRATQIKDFKATEAYLSEFKDKLSKRSEAKSGVMPWFALNRQRYPNLFEEDKIIMRQTSDKIRATFDQDGYYVIDSILVFKKDSSCDFSYKYLLSVLNSTALYFLYAKFTQEGGRTFAQVKPLNVRKLFVPKANQDNQKSISLLVDYLLFWNRYKEKNSIESQLFESVLDTTTFELFLGEELKSAGKEILKHLGDLKPITDQMSEEEKLAIIQSEFERLYDPNHPVRYAIETLDSIEEVRIIKEALK